MLKDQLSEQKRIIEKIQNDLILLERVENASTVMSLAAKKRLPILVAGNGGSASDALHFSGELVGNFRISRPPINMICLNSNVTAITAWANDVNYNLAFARQVEAHGAPNGVFVGFSTSGNSESIIEAARKAQSLSMTTICFTGDSGGLLSSYSDILINIPSNSTPRIQELHVAIYHYLSEIVEHNLFSHSDQIT